MSQADDYRHCTTLTYPGFSSLHPSSLPTQYGKLVSLSQGISSVLSCYEEQLSLLGIRTQFPRLLKHTKMRNFVKDAFWWFFLEYFVSVDFDALLSQVKGNTMVTDDDMRAFAFDTIVPTHLQVEYTEDVMRSAGLPLDVIPTLPLVRPNASVGAPTKTRLRDAVKNLPQHVGKTHVSNRNMNDIVMIGSPRIIGAETIADSVENKAQTAANTQKLQQLMQLVATDSKGANGSDDDDDEGGDQLRGIASRSVSPATRKKQEQQQQRPTTRSPTKRQGGEANKPQPMHVPHPPGTPPTAKGLHHKTLSSTMKGPSAGSKINNPSSASPTSIVAHLNSFAFAQSVAFHRAPVEADDEEEDRDNDCLSTCSDSTTSSVASSLRITSFPNSRTQLHKLPIGVRLQVAAKEQHQLFTRMALSYGSLTTMTLGMNVGLKDSMTRILPEVLAQLLYFLFAKSVPYAMRLLDTSFQINLGQKLSFWIGGVERIFNVRSWGIHSFFDPVRRARKSSRNKSTRQSQNAANTARISGAVSTMRTMSSSARASATPSQGRMFSTSTNSSRGSATDVEGSASVTSILRPSTTSNFHGNEVRLSAAPAPRTTLLSGVGDGDEPPSSRRSDAPPASRRSDALAARGKSDAPAPSSRRSDALVPKFSTVSSPRTSDVIPARGTSTTMGPSTHATFEDDPDGTARGIRFVAEGGPNSGSPHSGGGGGESHGSNSPRSGGKPRRHRLDAHSLKQATAMAAAETPEEAQRKKRDLMVKMEVDKAKAELLKVRTTHTFSQFHYSGMTTRQVATFRDTEDGVSSSPRTGGGTGEEPVQNNVPLPSRLAQAFAIGPRKRNLQVIKKDLDSKFLSNPPWYAKKGQRVTMKDEVGMTRFSLNNWSPLLHRYMLANGEENLRQAEFMNWTV